MRIVLLDRDQQYTENLAARLASAFPSDEIICLDAADEKADGSEADEDRLLIYTPEQFPDFKPKGLTLKLRPETPFMLYGSRSGAGNRPRRLGPVKDIIEAAQNYIPETSASASLSPISFILLPQIGAGAENEMRKLLRAASAGGIQTFMLELGPAYLFRENSTAFAGSKPHAGDFLLALSLKSESADNPGAFWEPSPLDPACYRMRLPRRSDDWLLISAELLRRALDCIKAWCEEHYARSWRLFICSCGLPFRLNRLIAASCEILYLASPKTGPNPVWDREAAELIALLPSGADCRELLPPAETLRKAGIRRRALGTAVPDLRLSEVLNYET